MCIDFVILTNVNLQVTEQYFNHSTRQHVQNKLPVCHNLNVIQKNFDTKEKKKSNWWLFFLFLINAVWTNYNFYSCKNLVHTLCYPHKSIPKFSGGIKGTEI